MTRKKDHTTGLPASSRRSFLRTATAFGSTAAISMGFSAGSLAQRPIKKVIPLKRLKEKQDPKQLRKPTGVGDKVAAGPQIIVDQVPKLATSRRPKVSVADMPGIVKRAVPKPATREMVLRSVAGKPGGPQLLRDMGISMPQQADASIPRTVQLTRVYRLHTLAQAYANGIMLTATGCHFAGGIYRGAEPLRYHSVHGSPSPESVRAQECRVWPSTTGAQAEVGGFLAFFLETPGNASERLPYILELSLTPDRIGYLADLDTRLRFDLNGEEIEFVRTSSGSLMAFASLTGGASGTNKHRIGVFGTRASGGIAYVRFDWLHVTAC